MNSREYISGQILTGVRHSFRVIRTIRIPLLCRASREDILHYIRLEFNSPNKIRISTYLVAMQPFRIAVRSMNFSSDACDSFPTNGLLVRLGTVPIKNDSTQIGYRPNNTFFDYVSSGPKTKF